MREFVSDCCLPDTFDDFEDRVQQQERRRQGRERSRRFRERQRLKTEQAKATAPRRKFIDYLSGLREDPSYGKLGGTDRRIIDCLIKEHARHCGTRTELAFTYAGFVAGKVSRRLIKPSLLKLEALGVVGVTWGLGGRRGRVANRYRLVFIDGPAAESVTPIGTTSPTEQRNAGSTERYRERYDPKSPAISTQEAEGALRPSVHPGGPLNTDGLPATGCTGDRVTEGTATGATKVTSPARPRPAGTPPQNDSGERVVGIEIERAPL
jgi:hypothetical protein